MKILKKLIKIPNFKDKNKVWLIDELNAIAIGLMIIYHTIFDLKFIFDFNFKFITFSHVVFIKLAFSSTFIFLSGTLYEFSKNKLKKGMFFLAFGLILTFITQLLFPNLPIKFGLLHLIGTSIILHFLVSNIFLKIKAFLKKSKLDLTKIAIYIIGLIFSGNFTDENFENFKFSIPDDWKAFLFPFGFHNKNFYSANYFPLFPWIFLFLLGIYFGKLSKLHKLPPEFYKLHFKPAAIINKNAMLIYLFHQPIIISFLFIILKIQNLFN